MKKQFPTILGIALIGISACSDDEGLQVQPHDQNRMMSIMHAMMDEMGQMEHTGDPDHDFAAMMRMHHQGAIDMAEEELASGNDSRMMGIAQQIIEAQETEIAILTDFLASHEPQTTSEEFAMSAMAAMEKMSRSKDLRVLTGDTDQDFALLMIDHHQSAVENAQALLAYGQTEAMQGLARQIIEDQQSEIKELQNWLLENKSY